MFLMFFARDEIRVRLWLTKFLKISHSNKRDLNIWLTLRF
jgi:hypothetical protein